MSNYKQIQVSDLTRAGFQPALVKSETSVSKYSKQAASDARTRRPQVSLHSYFTST